MREKDGVVEGFTVCFFRFFRDLESTVCFFRFLEVWSRLEGLYYWVLSPYVLSGFREKNKLEFFFF